MVIIDNFYVDLLCNRGSGAERNTKCIICIEERKNTGKLNVTAKVCAEREAIIVKINAIKEKPR